MASHGAGNVAEDHAGLSAAESEQFLAMAVHELRSPATVMVGAADTLLNLWGSDKFETSGPELLESLARNGRHLRKLVGDLLSSAYLERGALALAMVHVPIKPILAWAVETAAGDNQGVSIDCDPALHATVDADRLEQIIVNLITNALEHGGLPIQVAATPLPFRGEACITVRDHGRGVTLEDAPHLFERFSPLAERSSGSTGLGLSIARGLARAMGGDLVHQRAEPGSCFALTLRMD